MRSKLLAKAFRLRTDAMQKFLEWMTLAFPTQYIRWLLLPRVCRQLRNYHQLRIRPKPVPFTRTYSLVSHGLFDHIFGNDLATDANDSYHRVVSTSALLECTARATYFPLQPPKYRIPKEQLETHLDSMDGKTDNYCKADLKKSNSKTAHPLAQLNAHILCGTAMSPTPQLKPSWWSGYNWSVFFSTAFNSLPGQAWVVQTDAGVTAFNHNMKMPYKTVRKGGESVKVIDSITETDKHRAAKEMGYRMNVTKDSLQVCSHPMTLRIVSIEVIARVDHDPSKGCFSGAVGSVVGVHSNHSARMSNDAEELGIKMAHARLQAMSHQCELQLFIDFDKLIDIADAKKLWSAALCRTRKDFVASKAVMHLNWQNHVRECEERDLCPCKRCFTSVPPHPAHRHTVCTLTWAVCQCRIMWT